MLKMLSEIYNISINEILCGERLSKDSYIKEAEKNLVKALDTSMFTVKEKKDFFKKKWLKDHCFELVLEFIVIITAFVLCAVFKEALCFVVYVVAIVWSIATNNRIASYIEYHIFDSSKYENKEK